MYDIDDRKLTDREKFGENIKLAAAAKIKSKDEALIYFDVDGTLNEATANAARAHQEAGNKTVLWSARGAVHAFNVAQKLGCIDAFNFILSKPSAIVDDQGLTRLRFVKVFHPRRYHNG